MKVFIDTEFLDDGQTIDLISIGLFTPAARYYAVSSEFNWLRAVAHPWLSKNVLNHLPPAGSPEIKNRALIAHEVSLFLEQAKVSELWSYYSAYDHVALAQLWGPMSELPKHIPMRTRDVKDLHDDLGCPQLPPQGGQAHHARADAEYHYVMWKHLDRIRKYRALAGEMCNCQAIRGHVNYPGPWHPRADQLHYVCTTTMTNLGRDGELG